MRDAPAICFDWSKKRNPDFDQAPEIDDINTYGKELLKWGQKILRGKNKDKVWSDLAKGTHTGFFLLIISIAWLGYAKGNKGDKQLDGFMDEVQSSLKEMNAWLER
jgi:hypothetical protein